MYYAYVLKSLKDSKLYYGYSSDLNKRLLEHNIGRVKSTANRIPFVIVYSEQFETEKDAIQREKFFKTGAGRSFIKSNLKNINTCSEKMALSSNG